MTKMKKWFIAFVAVVLLVSAYVFIGKLSLKGKTHAYLLDKGVEISEIQSVKVKHSFLALLLSYNEWDISVEYYDEPAVTYSYAYRNRQIEFSGISGGSKEKGEYKHTQTTTE